MSRKVLIPLSFVMVLLAVPAIAGEIIHFTNGTTMAIQSYTVLEDTVRVNLGGQAIMEFPREQIERIETTLGSAGAPGKTRPLMPLAFPSVGK